MLVVAERWFWLNHTGGREGWPTARSGDHCAAGSWSEDPLEVVILGWAPRSVLVEDFNRTLYSEQQFARSGGAVGIHAYANSTWTMSLPSVFNRTLVLATVSLQGEMVFVNGEVLAKGRDSTVNVSYDLEDNGQGSYRVDERLVVRNFGVVPLRVEPGSTGGCA